MDQGQYITLTYTVYVTDALVARAEDDVQIRINGTNDGPVITNGAAALFGSVIEAGNLDDGTIVLGSNQVSGALSSSDLDVGSTATWSIVGTPSSTYGSIAINASSGVWTYSLDNSKAATGALKEGETVTQLFTARVIDNNGAIADQTITISIKGTNDSPTVATNVLVGTGVEAGNNDDGSVVPGTSSISGTLTVSDADAGATRSWTIMGTPSTTYGTFTIGASSGVWTYSLDNSKSATQALKEGQSVSEIFNVRITDDFGAYVDQSITVTINGTNDVPSVTNSLTALSGLLTESGNLNNGTTLAGTSSITGTLSASDSDSGATRIWSLTGTRPTTYGSIAIESTTGVWTYTLDNSLSATQGLNDGQIVTQTYTARVTDDFGAYVDQTITVTIKGTNDVPVLDNTQSPAFGPINEDTPAPLNASTANSTLISALGLGGISDVDSSALKGIAITAVNSDYGSLYYSTNGGSTWNPVGSVSSTTALLLASDSNTRLYFWPTTNYNGTIADLLTFIETLP